MLAEKAQSAGFPLFEPMKSEREDAAVSSDQVTGLEGLALGSETGKKLMRQKRPEGMEQETYNEFVGVNEEGPGELEEISAGACAASATSKSENKTLTNDSSLTPSDVIRIQKGSISSRCIDSSMNIEIASTIGAPEDKEPENQANVTLNAIQPLQIQKGRNINIAANERRRLFGRFYRKANRLDKVKPKNIGRFDAQNKDFLSITRSAFKRNISKMKNNTKLDDKLRIPQIACYKYLTQDELDPPHEIISGPSFNDIKKVDANIDQCKAETREEQPPSAAQNQARDNIHQIKPRKACWKPPSSWGVMCNRENYEYADNVAQRSDSTLESQTKSSEVSEFSEKSIVYDDPLLDIPSYDHHNYYLDMADYPRFPFTALRVYCGNLARLIFHCTEQTTTSGLIKSISERIGTSPTKKNGLFVSILGVERMMTDDERPFLLQKRLMEMFGYSASDRTNLLASMDHSYYYYFVYSSRLDKGLSHPQHPPSSLQLTSDNISLVNMNLTSIPLALYKYTRSIVSMQLSRNPNITNIPVNFARNLASLTTISLSNNYLLKFPSSLLLLKSLKELDLSRNFISTIIDVDFSMLKCLISMNLSANIISEISPDITKMCPLLESINLSNNFLTSLPPSIFLNAKNLKSIDFSWNIISGPIPCELAHAVTLKYIDFSHNSISGHFPNAFARLKDLVKLDLSDNMIGGRNGLESIANINEMLSCCKNLEWLSLDHNIIKVGSRQSQLSDKQCSDRARDNLATIKTKNLKHMSLSHQEPPAVICSLMVVDYTSSLTSLDLRYSGVKKLPSNFFTSLSVLEKLNLSGNGLNSLPAFSTRSFRSHQSSEDSIRSQTKPTLKLRELYLSHNTIQSIPSDIGSLSGLVILELQENRIDVLPDEIWTCSSLRTINLTSNRLRKFTRSSYHRLRYSSDHRRSRCEKRCKFYGTSQSPCRNCSTLSSTDNADNNRHNNLGSSLQYLYLSNNSLGNDICYTLFLLKHLLVLHCAINEINDISYWFTKNHDNNSQGVPWYSKLRELHLGCNEISVLPGEIENMKSLKWLLLNGNRLKTIPGELGKLKKLEVLDLSSQYSSNYESTKLHYNVTNWPYEWNWNWNLDLKYLNLSGNKRLEIKEINKERQDQMYPNLPRGTGTGGIVGSLLSNSRAACAAGAMQVSSAVPGAKRKLEDDNRNLVSFNALINLKFLGLIDVTCHSPPPDETHRRRIRATNSEIPLDNAPGPSIKYAIADILSHQMDPEIVRVGEMWLPQPPSSVDDHSGEADFEIWDLIVPKFRNRQDEALFAVFEGRGTSRGMRAAKYIYDNFSEIFANELEASSTQPRKSSDVSMTIQRSSVQVRKNSDLLVRTPNISLKTKKLIKDTVGPTGIVEKTGLFGSGGSNEPIVECAPSEAIAYEEQGSGHKGKKNSIDRDSTGTKERSSNIRTLCQNCLIGDFARQDASYGESERMDKTSKAWTKSSSTVRSAQCEGAAQNCLNCSSIEKINDNSTTMSSHMVKAALHRTFLRINRQIGLELGKAPSPNVMCADTTEVHAKQPSLKRQIPLTAPFQHRKMSSLPQVAQELSSSQSDAGPISASPPKQNDPNSTKSITESDDNIYNVMFGVSAIVLFFCSVDSNEDTPGKYRLFTANVGDSAAIISRNSGRCEILSELHAIEPRLNDRKSAISTSLGEEPHLRAEDKSTTTLSSPGLGCDKHPCWITSEMDRIKKSGGMFSKNCRIDGELDVTRCFGYYPLLGIINSNPTITETIVKFNMGSIQDISALSSPIIDRSESVESLQMAPGSPCEQASSNREDPASNTGDEFVIISSSSIFKAFCCGGGRETGAKRLASVARAAMMSPPSVRRSHNKTSRYYEDFSPYSGSAYCNYVQRSMTPGLSDWSFSAMKIRDTAIGLAGCENTRAGLVMILGLKDISRNCGTRMKYLARTPSLFSENQLSQSVGQSDIYDKQQNISRIQNEKLPRDDELIGFSPRSYASIDPPPQGQVALVFTDIKNSTKMWEECPSGMRSAIRQHHATMRDIILRTGGYEVKTEGDSFMISFSSVVSAVEMCIRAQLELLELDWPRDILYANSNKGGLYYNAITKNYYIGEFVDAFEAAYKSLISDDSKKKAVEEVLSSLPECESSEPPRSSKTTKLIGSIKFELLFSGLSVRMGVHWGSPLCEMDPVTFRMDYYGSMVNRAARVAGLAYGGQILMSSDSTRAIYDTLGIANTPSPSVRKGMDTLMRLPEFTPLLPAAGHIASDEAKKLASLNLHHRNIGFYKLRGLETPEVLFEACSYHLKCRSVYFEMEAKGSLNVVSMNSISSSSPSESPDLIVSAYWKMMSLLDEDPTYTN